MASIPSGTVTFLFTDVEGSVNLWAQHPQQKEAALLRQVSILREAIEANGGAAWRGRGIVRVHRRCSRVVAGDDQAEYDHALASIRSQLQETEFNKAHEEGRAMNMEQAITHTLEAN